MLKLIRFFVLILALLAFGIPLHAQLQLPQSATANIAIGPFLDSVDGITPKTALTLAQADIRLAKNGGTWAQKSDASSCTHLENGWYQCPINTTDSNTTGILTIGVTKAGAVPVWTQFMVVAATAYAANVTTGPAASLTTISSNVADIQARIPAALTASGNMKADTLRVNGTTQTAGDLSAQINTVNGYVDTEVASIKTQTDKLTFTVANQLDANILDWKSATAPAMTGDSFARLGAPAGASVSADVAAAKVDTAAIKVTSDRTAGGQELNAGLYRFTVAALANAPSGTGASAASIRAEMDSNSTKLASIDAKTTNLPSDPADQSLVIAAADAIKVDTAAIKVVTDKEAGALELDSGLYRWTAAALALANGTGASAAAVRAEMDSNSTKLAAIAASVAAGRIVKRSTAKSWPMKFTNSTTGALVTSGTPSCVRSIDSVTAFVTATSSGSGGVAASAVNARGLSQITLSTADTDGVDYVILECTLPGAGIFQNIFVIQQP